MSCFRSNIEELDYRIRTSKMLRHIERKIKPLQFLSGLIIINISANNRTNERENVHILSGYCCYVARHHLFAYKLTTKQNKDHNRNVKSNWKCHTYPQSFGHSPFPCAFLFLFSIIVFYLDTRCCLTVACRFYLCSFYQSLCLRLLSISVFMSVDIIVKCFEMAVSWYFIASDIHQFLIHFVYHFYCLRIHIFISQHWHWVCVIVDFQEMDRIIAKSLNIQHFWDMVHCYLDWS